MRSSCRWLMTLTGVALLQAGAAAARPVPCGVDLEALRTYVRTGKAMGTVVGAPVVGQRLYLHFDYRTIGAGEAPTAPLVALIDGEPICGPSPFEFQLGFAAVAFCEEPWRATEGTHTLRWEIDPDGALGETDEGNNAVEMTFTVARPVAVDIDARRAYLRTGLFEGAAVQRPTVGQQVYLHLDYRVTGAQNEVRTDLSAVVDGELYCSGPTEFQSDGIASFGCDRPWQAIAGVHTLAWVIDPTDAVQEADESNDFVELEVKIPAPKRIDFEATRSYLRTQPGGGGDEVPSPVCGESVYFHFNYGLLGTTDPVSAHLQALIDGLPQCLGPFPVQGDANTTFCPNPWVAAPGRHTLRLDIDSTNDIPETDEGNNAVELIFDVRAACAGDCDGDGSVSIAELILAVNIALGARPVGDCPSVDTNGDGQVAINELIAAVSNALNGCIDRNAEKTTDDHR